MFNQNLGLYDSSIRGKTAKPKQKLKKKMKRIVIQWLIDDHEPGGGASSSIFVRECATSGSWTPPFDKARQRQNFDPVLRQI